MAYVIFAHSHLYFKKSLHLVTHFFCLAHSAVRILVSTSYRAAGSPSAPRERQQKKNKKTKKKQGGERKKKRKTAEQGKREQVGLLYKFNTPTFPRVRSPLPRSPVAVLQWAGAAGSQEARVFIVAWVSGWGVSGRESSYSA